MSYDPNYNYYPQHSGSPPPLQHPIPTHPIQVRDPPASPSPPTQQRRIHQGQLQQGPPDFNAMWNLNDSTAQMGMQLGKNAMMAGSEYVEKNVCFYILYFVAGNFG